MKKSMSADREALPSREISFAEAATAWLQQKERQVKPSSHAYYTGTVKRYLLPEFGEQLLSELEGIAVSPFLQRLKVEGRSRGSGPLSDKTISDLTLVLRQIFLFSQERGWLHVLPILPRSCARPPKIQIFTRFEREKLERELLLEDSLFSLGVLLSLYGGLRIGEVCALKWEDFDFQSETVQIRRTVMRIAAAKPGSKERTRLLIGMPKTDCSLRTIPLPSALAQYLELRRQAPARYVLTGSEKRCLEPRAALAHFRRFLRRSGIAERSWHTLRHTFATSCVESGVDVKSLSEILGHADVKITLQRYVHPSLEAKRAQINKLPCHILAEKPFPQEHPCKKQ